MRNTYVKARPEHTSSNSIRNYIQLLKFLTHRLIFFKPVFRVMCVVGNKRGSDTSQKWVTHLNTRNTQKKNEK